MTTFKFSSQDKEWHQTLTNIFSNIIGLKTKPILLYDIKQLKKYTKVGTAVNKGNANSLWGASITESGLFWISPHLKTQPLVETANTIFHELLHIKYPKATETFVRELADSFIPLYENLSSNKRGLCKVFTPKKGWNKKLKVDEMYMPPVGERH